MRFSFVDTHCHLTFPQFDQDRDDVIKRAEALGVCMVNATVSLDELEAARELSERFESVYWTIGLSASEVDGKKVDETIEAARKHRKDIVGVGEVGLDYYWVKDKEAQERERENFARFIELSKELRLPLIVHSRDAEEDALRVLSEHGKKALLHCFSGSLELALTAVEGGHVISIPANVTHAKSRQHLARELPLESIVLETDAPYLSPTPKTRNEPANVVNAAEKIAQLRGISQKDVMEATTRNAIEFYGLNK
jgi:TatD DNase family protein